MIIDLLAGPGGCQVCGSPVLGYARLMVDGRADS